MLLILSLFSAFSSGQLANVQAQNVQLEFVKNLWFYCGKNKESNYSSFSTLSSYFKAYNVIVMEYFVSVFFNWFDK